MTQKTVVVTVQQSSSFKVMATGSIGVNAPYWNEGWNRWTTEEFATPYPTQSEAETEVSKHPLWELKKKEATL